MLHIILLFRITKKVIDIIGAIPRPPYGPSPTEDGARTVISCAVVRAASTKKIPITF
jgi:hypothetical protein